MKQIVLLALPIITLISCKKSEIPNTTIKKSIVQINQKATEVSYAEGELGTIVYVSGYNSEIDNWKYMYNMQDGRYGFFTYNRPGVGNSANVIGSRNAMVITKELKEVLEAVHAKPPYILVGHSMGGIYARLFYHQYPSLVKGIVLVDATHERQLDSLMTMIPTDKRNEFSIILEEQLKQALSVMPEGSVKEEFRANFKDNYAIIKNYPRITTLPIAVLTSIKPSAEEPAPIKAIVEALHQEWAVAAGSKGWFSATSKSGHYIQLDEPKLVRSGIEWVLNQ
ncbi:MAG: alpha/beta hydrolase [Chitinophagaceae bacterium]|nr:alpha/beta hydrolase [Chitinophagaceae bacterium]